MICGILGCFCYGGGDWLMMRAFPGIVLPDTPFRLGFTNGLMSESMILFFLLHWIIGRKSE